MEVIRRFLDRYNYAKTSFSSDWDKFYQRFESRFRGSEETIAKRIEDRYSEALKSILEKSKAFHGGLFLDLGCGRGEVLALAKSLGFHALGVDISAEAITNCKAKGFQAECVDVSIFLRNQPSESAVVVASMHVVEHLQMRSNRQLFLEAHRILKPGGVFLVETPSLHSLWASQRQFFLDPSHEKPLHPDFLKFMAEDVGFSHVEIIEFDQVDSPERANLSKSMTSDQQAEFEKLERWLYGPMDLALWAEK